MLIIQNLGWYFHMKKCECGCGMNTKTITSKYYRGHSPNSGFQYGQKNIDKQRIKIEGDDKNVVYL